MNVLVTGARLPAALEIVRALRRAGARVWTADSLRFPLTRCARGVRGHLCFPAPAEDFAAFRRAVLRFVAQHKIDRVVPISEEVFPLARVLPSSVCLFSPPLPLLRALHSKWELLPLARGCGIHLPRTVRADSHAEMYSAAAEMGDVVVKQEFSRGGFQTLLRPTPEEVAQLPLAPKNPWLVQERITGREVSSYCIAANGTVLAQTCYLPRYRCGNGAALYFEPLAHPGVAAFLQRFVAQHAISGHFGCDMMEKDDGALYLLECNPRATSGVHLLDPADDWGRCFLGEKGAATQKTLPRCSTLGVLLTHGPKVRLGDLWRARDTCFAWDDPLPFVLQGCGMVEILWRNRGTGMSPARAFTRDLEWDGDTPP